MLPNGPVWTNAGCPSVVCTMFGRMACLSSAMSEPTAPTSCAVTRAPPLPEATVILPRRARRSSMPDESASTAMISDAVTMSNPVSRSGAFAEPPRPETMLRSPRSSMSTTRRQVMSDGFTPGMRPR